MFSNKTNSSFSQNLLKGIKDSGKLSTVIFVIFLGIVQAAISGKITAINFLIVETIKKDDKQHTLHLLTTYVVLECVLHILEWYRLNKYFRNISIFLHKYFNKEFINELFINSSIKWMSQEKTNEIQTAIIDGTNSLKNVLHVIIRVINPILESISGLFIISIYTHASFILILVMLLIFYGGSKLMIREYKQRKKINSDTNSLNTDITFLSKTFLSSRINGTSVETTDLILDYSTRNERLHNNIFLEVRTGYTVLQITGTMSILMIMYLIANYSDMDTGKFLALFWNMGRVLKKMWSLFHDFASASRNAAKWSSLEKYLDRVESKKVQIKTELKVFSLTLLNGQNVQKGMKYQIMGEKGTGKSIFMLSIVMKLDIKHHTNWIYVEQRCMIPTQTTEILREYLDFNLNDESIFMEFVKDLGLEHIINHNTLDEAFKFPSGGEEKCVVLLKLLFPILCGRKKILVAFLDEVTAGLDAESQKSVQKIFNKINSKGTIIVMIDHHTPLDDVIQIPVEEIHDLKKYLAELKENKTEKLEIVIQ